MKLFPTVYRKLGVKRLLDFCNAPRVAGSDSRILNSTLGWIVKPPGNICKNSPLCRAFVPQSPAFCRGALRPGHSPLKVLTDYLRPKVLEALSDQPSRHADQVCDWLVATGGEPFGEAEWHVHLKPSRCRQIIVTLQASGLLEEVSPVGPTQMFQLPRPWLQD